MQSADRQPSITKCHGPKELTWNSLETVRVSTYVSSLISAVYRMFSAGIEWYDTTPPGGGACNECYVQYYTGSRGGAPRKILECYTVLYTKKTVLYM